MKKKETSTDQGGKSTSDKQNKFVIDEKGKATSGRRGKVIAD